MKSNLGRRSFQPLIGNSETPKVDGADFYVGEDELGHIHLDGEIHLLLTPALQRALLTAGLADRFPWGANWVQAPIDGERSAAHALWLFKIAYDRLQGTSEAMLLQRIASLKSLGIDQPATMA